MSSKKGTTDDEKLLTRCEDALAEINRTSGLIDDHLEVLAAIRIRLYGADKKSLDEVLKAAGELKRASLEELEEPKPRGSLDELFSQPEKKTEWPT